jgi:hypothetical protein
VRGSAKNVFGGKKPSRREGIKVMVIFESAIFLAVSPLDKCQMPLYI